MGYIIETEASLRLVDRYQNPTCKEAVPPCPLLDPEGLFATAGAVCSAFVGVLYGFLLLQV